MQNFDIINIDAAHFQGHTDELKQEYFEACEWIKDLGLNYEPTRFGSYKKDFELFFNPGNEDKVYSDEELFEDLHKYMNASLEAIEIIRIRKAFQQDNHFDFINILKKTIAGSPFRKFNKPDQARNFTFELAIASRFINAGYEVDLSNVADLICNIDGRKLFVECKRIHSIKQLRKRVKEANKQISKRLKNDHSINSRGMVAINLTDIFNPKGKFIVTQKIERIKQQNTDILHGFLLNKSKDISAGKHNKCLGLFCEYTIQALLFNDEDENIFVSSRCGTIYTYFSKQSDRKFLNTFWEKLGNQQVY